MSIDDRVAVAQLSVDAESCRTKMTALSNSADRTSDFYSENIASLISQTMPQVYQLAMFVRGDYDSDSGSRPVAQMDQILAAMVRGFDRVESNAQEGLGKLQETMQQIVALQTQEMIPLDRKVDNLVKEFEDRAILLATQASQKETELKALQDAYQAELEARNSLAQKLADAQSAKNEAELGWNIATLGITSLTGAPDIFGFDDQIRDIEVQIGKSKEGIDTTAKTLQELNVARFNSDQSSKLLQTLKDRLPATDQAITASISHAGGLQGSLIKMKQNAASLLTRAKKMQGGTNVTKVVATSKSDFSLGILNICLDALLYHQALEEIKKIRNELTSGYVGELPDAVADALAQLDAKLAKMASAPPPKRLNILGATYGGRVVTAEVRQLVRDDQTVALDSGRFTTDLIPDPLPGTIKVFTLLYQYDGQEMALVKIRDSSGIVTINPAAQNATSPFITTVGQGQMRLGRELMVIAVIWGDEIFNSLEVYNKIWDLEEGHSWTLNNDSFGKDPWPGVVKTGTLYYCRGQGFPTSVFTGKEGRKTAFPKS